MGVPISPAGFKDVAALCKDSATDATKNAIGTEGSIMPTSGPGAGTMPVHGLVLLGCLGPTRKGNPADIKTLDQYLTDMTTRTWARRRPRKRNWPADVYNGLTVRGILPEYPMASIRYHTAKLSGYNTWKDPLIRVDGNNYSLDDIEHQIHRKMGEARIHFAIVCASIVCRSCLAVCPIGTLSFAPIGPLAWPLVISTSIAIRGEGRRKHVHRAARFGGRDSDPQ